MKLVNGYVSKELAQKESGQLNDEAISTQYFFISRLAAPRSNIGKWQEQLNSPGYNYSI